MKQVKKIFTNKEAKNLLARYEGGYNGEMYRWPFIEKEEVLLTDILNSYLTLETKYMFVGEHLLSPLVLRDMLITAADIVLPLYDKISVFSKRKEPHDAMAISKAFIAGKATVLDLHQQVRRSVKYAKGLSDANWGTSSRDTHAGIGAAFAAAAAAEATLFVAAGQDISRENIGMAADAATESGDKGIIEKLQELLNSVCLIGTPSAAGRSVFICIT